MSGGPLLESAKRPASDALGRSETSKRVKPDESDSIHKHASLKTSNGTDLRILIKAGGNTPLHSAVSSALSTPTGESSSRQTSVSATRLRPIRFHTLANSSPEALGNLRPNSQSLNVSGVSVKDIGPYQPIEGHFFELQDGRCLKKEYSRAKRCTTCINKQARSDCLFHASRVFILRKASPTVTENTATFFCTFSPRSRPVPDYPLEFNRRMEDEEKEQLLATSVSALYTAMHKSLKHASVPNAIHRPQQQSNTRTCHQCYAIFFLSYWFCGECGRGFCSDCYNKIEEFLPKEGGAASPATKPDAAITTAQNALRGFPVLYTLSVERVSSLTKVVNGRVSNVAIRSLLTCVGSRIHGVNSLIPVTTQTRDHISMMCQDASRIKSLPIPTPSSSPIRTPRSDGAVHYDIDEKPTWIATQPMVISGIDTKWEVDWSPTSFAGAFARIDCEIQESLTGSTRKTKVSDFFNEYGKNSTTREGIWRIKDWLPTTDLKTWQRDLYDDFLNMLPMPDFTRPDGALNYASRLPTNGNNPDLGPHLYCAYRSEDKDGIGTTKLHIEALDAINIMVYASDHLGAQGEAIWHIYPRESIPILREYCYQYLAKILSRAKNQVTGEDLKRTLDNPIYLQQIYLGPTAREELAKRGATCWVITQRVGEAITIPAGCAYQSCNMADCIKVALNFASVQSAQHISPGPLTETENGYQKEVMTGAWKGDVLHLKNMLYHAWISLSPPALASIKSAPTPLSAKSNASTPTSAKPASSNARTPSEGASASTSTGQAPERQPWPPLLPKKGKSVPGSASPTLYTRTLYDQPPTSDVRSLPGSPALSTVVASASKTSRPSSASASTTVTEGTLTNMVTGTATSTALKIATPVVLDDDMDLESEVPVIAKRPLPRLRGRSPSEIEPVLKPVDTSHVRQRPASSLPEDQDAFFDDLVTMLFDPKAGIETGLSDADVKNVRQKLRVIVKKIYLSSIEHGGLVTADYDALLQAAEPEVIAIFDAVKNRDASAEADQIVAEEGLPAAATSNVPVDPQSKPSSHRPEPPAGTSDHSGVSQATAAVVPSNTTASSNPPARSQTKSSAPIRGDMPPASNPPPVGTDTNAGLNSGLQASTPAAPTTADSAGPRSIVSIPPSQSAGPAVRQASVSQAAKSPRSNSLPAAIPSSAGRVQASTSPVIFTRPNTTSRTSSPLNGQPMPAEASPTVPRPRHSVPAVLPPHRVPASTSATTIRPIIPNIASPALSSSNASSPAVTGNISRQQAIYLRQALRPQAHEERPYTTEAPPREPLRLDLRGTTQAAYWYSLYG